MVKGYCRRCKTKQEILNPRLEKVPSGYRITNFVKGTCQVCGQKISAIVSDDFDPSRFGIPISSPPTPKYPDFSLQNSAPFKKLTNEELESMQRTAPPQESNLDDEDISVLKQIRDDKRLREEARKNGVSVGRDYTKWILITLAVGIIIFGYLGYNSYYKSDIGLVCGNVSVENTCPTVNLTCPDCNPTIQLNSTLVCGDIYINSTGAQI